MPVRLLITALATLAVGLLAAGVMRESSALGLAAVPFVVALVLAWAFRPQLEYSYLKRRPSDLDEAVVKVLETQAPSWYAERGEGDRLALRRLAALVQRGFDFRGQGFAGADVPDDVTALLATQAARAAEPSGRLTLEPVETVVVYRHAFPSPQFPERLHHSELYPEDGVVLLDLERAVPGIMTPREFFNVALYEFARAARLGLPAGPTPADLPDWRDVARELAGAGPEWVAGNVGLDEADLDAEGVLQVLRLEFAEAFAKTYPAADVALAARLAGPTPVSAGARARGRPAESPPP